MKALVFCISSPGLRYAFASLYCIASRQDFGKLGFLPLIIHFTQWFFCNASVVLNFIYSALTSMPSRLTIGISMAKSRTKIPRSQLVKHIISGDSQRQENRQLLERINAAYDGSPDVEEEKRLRLMRNLHRRLLLTEPREA